LGDVDDKSMQATVLAVTDEVAKTTIKVSTSSALRKHLFRLFLILFIDVDTYGHRLSIYRPTKRGKEKSPSDGHCQCEKEMDDHLLACQILEREPHSVKHSELRYRASIIFEN
jgi:hypothetical protein